MLIYRKIRRNLVKKWDNWGVTLNVPSPFHLVLRLKCQKFCSVQNMIILPVPSRIISTSSQLTPFEILCHLSGISRSDRDFGGSGIFSPAFLLYRPLNCGLFWQIRYIFSWKWTLQLPLNYPWWDILTLRRNSCQGLLHLDLGFQPSLEQHW